MNGNGETSNVHHEVEDLKMVTVSPFQKKMRLPKIFNYYYIIDTSDPTGKSLRAMCKTCETTICYSRRATSNLITHLKRKHPMNYADYAELQPPAFITGGHNPFLSTSNSIQSSDARGDPIIFQVQGGTHNQQQMMELSKPQYQSMDGIPSQPASLSENGVYGAYVPASSDGGMPHVVSVHGMHYAVTTDNSQHETNTHPIHIKRSSNLGDNQSNTSQSSTPQQSIVDGDVSGSTMTGWNHELYDSKDWLTLFMADTMLPSSIVDNSNFKGFVKSLNQRFLLPSAEILTNEWMPQKQDHIKTTIMELLDEINDVCLIVTKWQHSQEQFFVTFTMCFIKDWTFTKVFLACKIFVNDPPNDIINGIILNLEEEFGLNGKITQRIMEKGTTDSAQLHLPGFMADEVASVSKMADERDEKPEILEKDKCDRTASEQWLSSFEQALHNCITDGLRDVQQISSCISKLVQSSKIGQPNGMNTQTQDVEDDTPQARGWLQQIKFLKTTVNDSISSSDKTLSDSERNLLGEFLDTLEPFEDAMDYICKHQENIPISFAVPCIHGLQRHLQTINRSHCQRLLFQLKASLAKNFCKFEGSQMCQFAAALDPRFKMNWCSQSEAFSLKQSLLKTSLQTAEKFNIHGGDVHQSEEVEEDAGNTSKLFKLMGSPQQSRPNIQQTKVQEEVNNYLSLPCTKNTTDPLLYWKMHREEFPTLAQLASSILCIPAASLVKENVVMALGVPLLTDLPKEQLERLIFLRNNASLY